MAYAVTHQEEALSITDAFRKGWGKIGSYLWIGILTGLITMVGFILLVVPGIIFSIWYLFGTMVFLTEGDRGQKALEKSKAYVRGYWWAIAGRQIILGIIILCLNILAAIATLAAPGNALASQATQLIIQILYGPFAVVYLYRLYLQLRAVKPSTSYPLT